MEFELEKVSCMGGILNENSFLSLKPWNLNCISSTVCTGLDKQKVSAYNCKYFLTHQF